MKTLVRLGVKPLGKWNSRVNCIFISSRFKVLQRWNSTECHISWKLVSFHTGYERCPDNFEISLTFSLVSNQWVNEFSTFRPICFLGLFAPYPHPLGPVYLDSRSSFTCPWSLDLKILGTYFIWQSWTPCKKNDKWLQILGAVSFSRIFHKQLNIFHWCCYTRRPNVKEYLNPKYRQ